MTAQPKPRPAHRDQLLLFARNFFKHPLMLGSLIPSSRYLIAHLLRQMDWPRTRVVVEYGPGVGTITSEVLRRMPADGTLVAIEMNEEFVEYLREALPDPRLHVIHGSAEDVAAVLARLGCGPGQREGADRGELPESRHHPPRDLCLDRLCEFQRRRHPGHGEIQRPGVGLDASSGRDEGRPSRCTGRRRVRRSRETHALATDREFTARSRRKALGRRLAQPLRHLRETALSGGE